MNRSIGDNGLMMGNRDLLAVLAVVCGAVGLSLLGGAVAVGLPMALALLFVLPGYVTMELAYAERERSELSMATVVERAAFSLGLSMAIVPILGLLAYFSPLTLTDVSVVAFVAGYVVIVAALTALRRGRSAESGGRNPGPASGSSISLPSPGGMSTRGLLVNGVLVVSLLAATAALGGAILAPQDGTGTTDLHLLTESGDRAVAADYPATLRSGETATVTVGVTNEERAAVDYGVVAQLQRVRIDGQSVEVVEKVEIDRREFSLDDGETWRRQVDVDGELTGENLRLSVYLYRGDAPGDPTAESAYRHVYLWLDVQPGTGSS